MEELVRRSILLVAVVRLVIYIHAWWLDIRTSTAFWEAFSKQARFLALSSLSLLSLASPLEYLNLNLCFFPLIRKPQKKKKKVGDIT